MNKKAGFFSGLLLLILLAFYIFAWVKSPTNMEDLHMKFLNYLSDKGTDLYSKITKKELKAEDIPSPKDRIQESQIRVYEDKIEIDIENAVWSKYKDTNSMDPVIDEGANGIGIVPENEEDIIVGDIISYYEGGTIIAHRVKEIGHDSKGTYYMTEGDNNGMKDFGKVRFEQIRSVLVAILY